MSKDTAKKTLGIITKVVTWLVVVFAVLMMVFTVFSVLTFDRNDRNLFGTRFYVVQTNSMSLSEKNKDDKVHFSAGDVILIKNVADPRSLEAGEIISFISQNSTSYLETITHRIRERKYDVNGEFVGYVTYGTNTDTNDEAVVEPEYVIGVYSGKIPKLGYFFEFLRTTPGYIVCILVPFMLLIIYQGVNAVRLFRRYKKEQMADMEAEREQIAAERKQSAEMMRELQALREQLAQQTGAQPSTVIASDSEAISPSVNEKSDSDEAI